MTTTKEMEETKTTDGSWSHLTQLAVGWALCRHRLVSFSQLASESSILVTLILSFMVNNTQQVGGLPSLIMGAPRGACNLSGPCTLNHITHMGSGGLTMKYLEVWKKCLQGETKGSHVRVTVRSGEDLKAFCRDEVTCKGWGAIRKLALNWWNRLLKAEDGG